MEQMMDYGFLAARFVIETGFLLAALFLMVKLQKFQYHFWGLLGSAAAASALDMIPHYGHYIAVPVLYGCLLKVTREDMTGVVFTAAISYALVFGMNLFLLGALMGELHVLARGHAPTEATDSYQPDPSDSDTDAGTTAQKTNAPAAPQTEPVVQPAKASVLKGDGKFTIKGITSAGNRSTAMISTGLKTYTVEAGETVAMETAQGKVNVTCSKITDHSVELSVGGQTLTLSH